MSDITIEVPLLAPGLNGSKGMIRSHFSAYKKVKDDWTWYVRKACPAWTKAPVPCVINVYRYYAKNPMDADNLYSSTKIPNDVLKICGIIEDDGAQHIADLRCYQIKVATMKEEKTVIVITEPGEPRYTRAEWEMLAAK